jgi:NTE family protein
MDNGNTDGFQFIQANPLFQALDTNELEAILACLQVVHYLRGDVILERGVWHGRLYVVMKGAVSVLPEAAPYAVARLERGECFGELSLLTGEPPNATIRVEQDVTLLSLSQADLLELLGVCPTLLKNMHTMLARRLTRTNQQLAATRHYAQLVLLSAVEAPDTGEERSLFIHIVTALAQRTHKRVLLLALDGLKECGLPRFAVHPEQLRPTVLACLHEATTMQAHSAPTLADDGQHFAALTALAETRAELPTFDDGVRKVLADLGLLYDYVVLTATSMTPPEFVTALTCHDEPRPEYVVKQHLALLAADRVQQHEAQQLAAQADAVCVVHVPELPTIGMQDVYAEKLATSVLRVLPEQDALLQRCWQQGLTLATLAADEPLSRGVDFIARYIAHQTVGIAFGGGGARGFAHLGVLEALLAHSVPLDYIAACSSGIITAGTYLLGKSLAESEAIFMQIQRNITRWTLPRTAIFSNRGIKQMLLDLCGDKRFEDLTTPFAMVAVDLSTRSGVVLDRGPLWQAGLASVALPGIFPPVVIGQHLLMDAGIHDPVPIRLTRKMGAHILLASELGGQDPPALERAAPWLAEAELHGLPSERSPHIVDLLLRSYDLIMATIGMHSIREADVVFRPKLHTIPLRQFSKGRKFVASGYDAVEQMLPALKQHLPWLA